MSSWSLNKILLLKFLRGLVFFMLGVAGLWLFACPTLSTGRAAEEQVADDAETAALDDADDDDAEAGDDDEDSEEAEKDEYWKKPPEEWSLDQVREFQSFTYIRGGRNPFNFRLPAKSKAGEGKQQDVNNQKVNSRKGVAPSAKDQRKYFIEQILRVELLIVAHDYKSAMAVCEKVRNTVMNQWGGPPSQQENYILFQKLLSYEKTAKRLQRALETRKEFESFIIDIRGIRWTPQEATVLIGDKIYEPGSMLKDIRSAAPVQVEMILEDAVIFIYKGQRFRKSVVPEIENQEK